MNRDDLKSVVEGLIFAHPEPIRVQDLAGVIKGVGPETLESVLGELEAEYAERARGFQLCRVAGGYQFRTVPDVAPWLLEMKKAKPARLSRAALETLAIVAYNQPVTKSRIERIRGVESSATVRGLIERGLIEVVGRKDVPGRPMLYGTSQRFLEIFGLPDLASLPPLPELEEVDSDLADEEHPTGEVE